MSSQAGPSRTHKVTGYRDLTDATFVLTLERLDFRFTAGQHMALGLPDSPASREYSVYSGETDTHIEVLIREVEDGVLTPVFKTLRPGDDIRVFEPVGSFVIPPEQRRNAGRFVFVASGTGIAPFHSFTRTYADLDYQLLHGVRHTHEAYEHEHYAADRTVLCTSRDPAGTFHGRVTDYLRQHPIDTEAVYYVCGNYQMINEAYTMLEEAGVPGDRIRSEVYFHF